MSCLRVEADSFSSCPNRTWDSPSSSSPSIQFHARVLHKDQYLRKAIPFPLLNISTSFLLPQMILGLKITMGVGSDPNALRSNAKLNSWECFNGMYSQGVEIGAGVPPPLPVQIMAKWPCAHKVFDEIPDRRKLGELSEKPQFSYAHTWLPTLREIEKEKSVGQANGQPIIGLIFWSSRSHRSVFTLQYFAPSHLSSLTNLKQE
ncbi:hypothetical protein H6P81_012198 [Aristolochia fimbriata]|uniref:Uncharacterized protein n=1 Tax=Aristolochia fimbriata TaxID=158543 RepID=A0AAV7EB47_ARIFI|nr:hypothetical protein H6P81_012198 [Aristolochia fimbriata]